MFNMEDLIMNMFENRMKNKGIVEHGIDRPGVIKIILSRDIFFSLFCPSFCSGDLYAGVRVRD